MNNLEAIYKRILEVLRKISKDQLLAYLRKKPKMGDLEVIAVVLTSEYLGMDSENNLFKKLPTFLSQRIERSVYNRRKWRLFGALDDIRKHLSNTFAELEDVFIVEQYAFGDM